MKPVEWNSVPALAAELSRYQTSPSKLIGKTVIAYVVVNKPQGRVIKGSRGPRLKLSPTDVTRIHLLHLQLVKGFDAIYDQASANEKAEYRLALEQAEGTAEERVRLGEGPAVMAQVPPAEIRAEQKEFGKVVIPARRAEASDMATIGAALRPPHNKIRLVGVPGTVIPESGPVYGVVVGVAVREVPAAIPSFTYGYGFTTRAFTLSKPHKYFQVTLLYCGIAPHYSNVAKKAAVGPIKGYVFKMKSGTKMDATTYTIGDFYYHLKWNGIDLPVAKDLVVKIIPVR
jgi:hypothetical protein